MITEFSPQARRMQRIRPRLELLEDRLAPATLLGLTSNNSLLRFDSATPGTTTTVAISNLNIGENVLGIDYRPANGQLYAITSANRLLTINSSTGAATFVATLTADPADTTDPFTGLNGSNFGVDFNPIPDRLRVVSDADQNLRINPDTGTVITDSTLAYAGGDTNAGTNPNVVASAYANNFAGTTTTTLFNLDSNLDILVTQSPPNNGTLNTVGSLGQTLLNTAGFDILTTGTGTNTAFAVVDDSNSDTNLATINLSTGAATLVGDIGDGSATLIGLAVVPAGTLQFSVSSLSVRENAGQATITVTRTGGSQGAVSVNFATSDGTASAGQDYTAASGTVNFADGDTTAKTFTISILDDQLFEGPESIVLTLSGATGDAVLGPNDTSILTIADNELPRTILYGLTTGNALVEVDSATPGTIRRTTPILGLSASENVVGIDFRPATNQLYGLVVDGTNARLVTINIAFGFTTQVGASFTVAGTDFGFDFNPTNDRIRVTSDADINLSVNPNNGAVTPQTALTPGNPNIVGSAYTNSFAGANATTLYAIDSETDQLFIQDPPATGTLALVGNLGVDTSGLVGFDIVALQNLAFASLTTNGSSGSEIHSIDLATGEAFLLGSLGSGTTLRGLTSLTLNTVNFTANQRFVTQLFVDLLGRQAEANAVAFYSAQLDSGTSRAVIANSILASVEYRTLVVQQLYQRLLDRSADAGGLNAFVNFLGSGGTVSQATAFIIGSPEYFTLNGGTNASFLAAAYLDILGRPIDASGQAFFTAQLNAGTLTRSGVAQTLLNSPEGLQRQVQSIYQRFLLRAADPTGLTSSVSFLQAGGSLNALIASILGSPEYNGLLN